MTASPRTRIERAFLHGVKLTSTLMSHAFDLTEDQQLVQKTRQKSLVPIGTSCPVASAMEPRDEIPRKRSFEDE